MLLYLRRISKRGDVFREILRTKPVTPKKIVVDFSSPNIAKQFHVGNLRSTLIGNFYCKVNRLVGHEVVALNYLGDWGTQFGLLAAHWPESEYRQKFNELPADTPLSIKLEFLQKAYVEAAARAKTDEDFRKNKAAKLMCQMETALIRGEREAPVLSLWYAIRKLSTEYLNDFYERLGIKFDVFDAESDHVELAKRFIDNFIDNGHATLTIDGLWTVRDDLNGGYAVLRKSDDTTLYLSREIAATVKRDQVHQADSYVYVVDRAQTRHFIHLKFLLGKLNKHELADKISHIGFGRVVGMSTRSGRCETVEQILADGDAVAKKFILKSPTIKATEEEIPEVARELAETALFVNDMKRGKNQDYSFSFKDIFRKNSPFIVHEKYSRITSLLECNADLVLELDRILESESQSLALRIEDDPNIRLLCQCLYELDASLFSSFLTTETAPLYTYLVRLAGRIGTAMATARVKDEPDRKKALSRLLVFMASRNVLEEGLQLLGLKPLPRL